MDATTLTIAFLALVGAGVLAYLYWDTTRKRRSAENVPPAMRPGYSDEELEKTVLERYMGWGVVLTVFFALFLPLFWIYETQRLADATEERFVEQVVTGEELYQENCAECHGGNLAGGAAASPYEGDDAWPAPALNTIAVRYEDNPNVDDIESFVWETLYWGRPGSPMPAFGEDAAGPFTDEQLENIQAFLLANQVDEEQAEEIEEEAPDDAEEAEEDEDAEEEDAEEEDAEEEEEAEEEDAEAAADDEEAAAAEDDEATAEQAAGETAAAAGEELYAQNCMRCHGEELLGWEGEQQRPGFPLIGVFERHTSAGVLGILRNGIVRPKATMMPPFQNGYQHQPFEDDELVALINYLRERQPEEMLPEGEEEELSLGDIEGMTDEEAEEADDDEADEDPDDEAEDEAEDDDGGGEA